MNSVYNWPFCFPSPCFMPFFLCYGEISDMHSCINLWFHHTVPQTIPDALIWTDESSAIPSFTKAGKLVECPHICQTRGNTMAKLAQNIVCFYKTPNVLAKQVICITDNDILIFHTSVSWEVYNWSFCFPNLCFMPFFNCYGEIHWHAFPH
jgi:hypothetical protein